MVKHWLFVSNKSDISSLGVNPKSKVAKEENMGNCLWFKADEQEKANEFLKTLKMFIKEEYNRRFPGRAKWLTDDWVNKIR